MNTRLKRRTPFRRRPKGRKTLTAQERAIISSGITKCDKCGRLVSILFPMHTCKPRKRLPAQSDRMKERQKEYRKAKKEWWAERLMRDGGQCEARNANGERCRKKASDKPHHKAGRLGKNLSDTSKWMAVCTLHHRWIHDNPREAESLGFIIREYEKH